MKSWSGVAVTIGLIGRAAVQTEQESRPHLLGGVVAEAHARATPVYPSASGRDNGGRAAVSAPRTRNQARKNTVWQRREKRSPRLAGDEWSEHLPDGVAAAKG